MRIKALALTLLLCACTAGERNAAENAEANVTVSGTVTTAGNGATNGEAAPQAPGAAAPEPAGSVTLSAAPARVSPGATMTLTLRNGSSGQVGYNLCTSAIETTAGQAVPSDRVCTMELRTLEPGRSATYAYEIPSQIASGSYRFVTNASRIDGGAQNAVRSNTFEVR